METLPKRSLRKTNEKLPASIESILTEGLKATNDLLAMNPPNKEKLTKQKGQLERILKLDTNLTP